MNTKKKVLAIFASGTGSNAMKIINYVSSLPIYQDIKFIVLSNKADALVLQKAKDLQIETFVFNRKKFYEDTEVIEYLYQQKVDIVVLAGFLWLVPLSLIEQYPKKIINIHPALLPKFGGKGMFGMHIHQAVKNANESETGITIHYVNANYDEGEIILQKKCPVYFSDTPEDIAKRVLTLEHEWFPKVVAELLLN
jgi:phosphoribosylglycinamide formyltransferase-1